MEQATAAQNHALHQLKLPFEAIMVPSLSIILAIFLIAISLGVTAIYGAIRWHYRDVYRAEKTTQHGTYR
jgi:hypothetical protein